MSQIRFYALGGLGENGKNMYCVEVDGKIVVLDAGLKHPTGNLLGVDAIVPDISYLESRSDDILAVMLSHAHDKNIGALPMLLKRINVPVYGTGFAIAVAKDLLTENRMDPAKYIFNIIGENDRIEFPGFSVEFYATTHSVPESAGVAILTEDGAIVYATDFTFDQNSGSFYQTDFQKLTAFNTHGVLALLSESSGALSLGHSSTDYNLTMLIRETFQRAKHRVIVAMYSTELSNIQKVINEALAAGKKLAIIGRKAQRLVDIGENLGYIQIPADKLVNLRFIDDENQNDFDDVVFLVTGEKHEPFFMLQRMAKGFDRLIHLKKDDTVLMMSYPIVGTEKIAAKTYDTLFRMEVNLIRPNKKILPFFHASAEDIKLLYTLLKPKYIVPINGEFRHQLAQHDLAIEYGYSHEQIALVDNGETITFENGILINQHDMIMNGSLLIDGNFETDINDAVLKERELLADDGFLMIVANIDSRERVMKNEPEIVSRGFMPLKPADDTYKQIVAIYKDVTTKSFQEANFDWKVYREQFRYEVQKYLYGESGRKPVVIPMVIDVSEDRPCKEI